MKKLLTFTLIMIGALSNPTYGSIKEYSSETEPEKNPDNNHDRPELPAQDGITCEYDGSYLIIKFENGEGMASMMLSYASDGSEIDRVNFSASSDFVYYIGEINEPVKVEINGAGRYYSDVID